MIREMRRKDRAISQEAAEQILKEGEYGILATVGEEGYPYTTPLNYAYVDGAIYFHCALEGHKLDNIRKESKISFCVVGATKLLPQEFGTLYESVVVFGRASVIEDEKEKTRALEALIDKYAPQYKEAGMDYVHRSGQVTCVVKITIDRMTGKARQDKK